MCDLQLCPGNAGFLDGVASTHCVSSEMSKGLRVPSTDHGPQLFTEHQHQLTRARAVGQSL